MPRLRDGILEKYKNYYSEQENHRAWKETKECDIAAYYRRDLTAFFFSPVRIGSVDRKKANRTRHQDISTTYAANKGNEFSVDRGIDIDS